MGSSVLPKRVCLLPRLSGVGGMVSFQKRLVSGLAKRGVEVTYDVRDRPYRAVLVIGGTRQLLGLSRAKQRGVPVVQRLDGMNWIHRLPAQDGGLRTGLRHFLRAEYGNLILATIRSRLASTIVYQSEFSRLWWETMRGPAPGEWRVVYNGVDLQLFQPAGPERPPTDRCRVLLVEGSLMGGYELGVDTAVALAGKLAEMLPEGGKVELAIAGRVTEQLRTDWNQRLPQAAPGVTLTWLGNVPGEQIPAIDRSAHLLYSADVNPACPNSVIEALACGLPVLAYNTGALAELVQGEAGRIVPYGGNPWKLEWPDVPALAQAALELYRGQERSRNAARQRAEARFGLDTMIDSYLQVLL